MELEGRSAVIAGGAGGLGPAAAAVTGSSTDDDAVAEAIARAQALGVFSVAVSAAGVVIPSSRLATADGTVLAKDTLLANLDLHVVGPFWRARPFWTSSRTG